MKRTEVHVERLVLHGLSAARGRAVAAAVRRELARLGGEGRIPAGNPGQARQEVAAGVAAAVRGAKR
ncbi:MAG TPA: hypothetical protein VF173_18400 [Thermoanaerobaculia bacterium]|nr:hypothetical protein [Thermoanaerobaculia bacterium]